MEGINITRKQSINDSIHKNHCIQNKYYFAFFDDCSEELRTEYLARATLPNMILPKGTKVHQIDINTRKIINTYDSIADALKKHCMSRATLKRACANNEVHNGFLWKYAE